MFVPIVNEKDEIICYKNRSEIDYKNDIFRAASIWIINNKGETLLAQRKFDKAVDPGKWGEAVGGTVEGDDSYYDTVIREAEEELGLKQITIKEGPKQFLQTKTYSCYVQWYIANIDKNIEDFIIQKEEIEQISWVPITKLKYDLINNPENYVSDFIICYKLLN